MPGMALGDGEVFSVEEVGLVVNMLKYTPAGAVYTRMLNSLKNEQRDLLVTDLSEKDTAKIRGAFTAIETIGDLLLKRMSDWHAMVTAPPKPGTEPEPETSE